MNSRKILYQSSLDAVAFLKLLGSQDLGIQPGWHIKNSQEGKLLLLSHLIVTSYLCIISRPGYRYGILLPANNVCQDPLNTSIAVLQKFDIQPEMYQVGYTKLFFRAGQVTLYSRDYNFLLIHFMVLVLILQRVEVFYRFLIWSYKIWWCFVLS